MANKRHPLSLVVEGLMIAQTGGITDTDTARVAIIARSRHLPEYFEEVHRLAQIIAVTLPNLLRHPRSNTTPGAYVSLAEAVQQAGMRHPVSKGYAYYHAGCFYALAGGWGNGMKTTFEAALEDLEGLTDPNAKLLRRAVYGQMLLHGLLPQELWLAIQLANEMRRHSDPSWPEVEAFVIQRIAKIRPALLDQRVKRAQEQIADHDTENFYLQAPLHCLREVIARPSAL